MVSQCQLRMRQWKKDNKPEIKMLIAKAHRNIAAVERNICQFKVIINLGIEGIKNVPTAPSLADKKKIAAIKQGIKKAVDEQKCAVELIKFFKTMIVCLSHAYNENITKANKYGVKLATELDVSRINAMDDNERKGIKTSLDVVEKCLKMLPPVLVAREANNQRKHSKKMTETLKLMLEMGEWAEDHCDWDGDEDDVPECVEEDNLRCGLNKHIYNNGTVSAFMVVCGRQYGVASSWGMYHGR